MSGAQPRRAGVVPLVLAALVLLAATLVVGGCGEKKDAGKVASPTPTPTADKYVGRWKTNGGVVTITKAGETWILEGRNVTDEVKRVTLVDLKEDGDMLQSHWGTVTVSGDTMTFLISGGVDVPEVVYFQRQ